jgi:hypothetical protein
VPKIRLAADDKTEELVTFIAANLDDDTLDATQFHREHAKTAGLASEPVTTAVLIAATPIVVRSVARLVERWLESRRQAQQLGIVLDGFGKSDEAGRQLAQLATKYADVSVAFGPLPALPEQKEL